VWDPWGLVLLQCQVQAKAKEFEEWKKQAQMQEKFGTVPSNVNAEERLNAMQKDFERTSKEHQEKVSTVIDETIRGQVEPVLRLWKRRVFGLQLVLVAYTGFFSWRSRKFGESCDVAVFVDPSYDSFVMPAMNGTAEKWMGINLVVAFAAICFHETFSEKKRSRWAKSACCLVEGLVKAQQDRINKSGAPPIATPASGAQDDGGMCGCFKSLDLWDKFMKLAMVVGSVLCLMVAATFKGYITTDSKVERVAMFSVLTNLSGLFWICYGVNFLLSGVVQLRREVEPTQTAS